MAVTDLLPTFVIRISRERIDTFCLEPDIAPWAQIAKYSECLRCRYSMLYLGKCALMGGLLRLHEPFFATTILSRPEIWVHKTVLNHEGQ